MTQPLGRHRPLQRPAASAHRPPAPPRGTAERTKVRLPTAILVHPFELGFAAIFEIVGIGLFIQGPHLRVSSVQTLPDPLVWCWEVFLLLAGPAIVFGLLWSRTPAMGRGVEIAGLSLAAAAWSSYAVTIWAAVGSVGIPSALQAVTIAVVCMLRVVALRKVNKVVAHVNAARKDDAA